MTDAELLGRWADSRDERAFRELVARVAPLVHGVALRRLGHGSDLAEEATQRVFTMLARKAGPLKNHPCLSAWLHRATVLETTWIAREEARRRQKLAELAQHADFMASNDASTPEWQATLPEIDAALERLPEPDRHILILRYFEGRSFREIGRLLGKNEAAAQKQGIRALERLSTTLRRRGIAATTAMLAAGLGGGAIDSASAAPLAAAWAAEATHAAGTVGFFQSLNHSLQLMTYGKATTLAVAAAILLASLGGSYALGRHRAALAAIDSQAGARSDDGAGADDASARTRTAAGPGSLGLTQAVGRDLRSRLEGLTKVIVVDPDQRSVNFMGVMFGPGGQMPQNGSIADLASIDHADLEPAIAIMGEWRDDPKKFETIAALISSIMSERDAPETVVRRLMTPEFSRHGKPPVFAFGMALRAWAGQSPKAAWDFFRTQSDAGKLPTDTWKPYFPEILTAYVARDTASALAEIRTLPESWNAYVGRALGSGLEDKGQRDALLQALDASADDRLALLVASSQPKQGQWVGEKLLPWLTARPWQRPDGVARALHSMIWREGFLDEDRLSLLTGSIDRLPTPEANAAALEAVRGAFAEVKALAGEKKLQEMLQRHVNDASLREKIARSL